MAFSILDSYQTKKAHILDDVALPIISYTVGEFHQATSFWNIQILVGFVGGLECNYNFGIGDL